MSLKWHRASGNIYWSEVVPDVDIESFDFTIETTTATYLYQSGLFLKDATSYVDIDWGDGSAIETFNTSADIKHTYATTGTYQVKALNFYNMDMIYFDGDSELISIDTQIPSDFIKSTTTCSASGAFSDCDNLTSLPSLLFYNISHNLDGDFSEMCRGCTSLIALASDTLTLTTIDAAKFSGWGFQAMFAYCTALTTIPTGFLDGIPFSASDTFYTSAMFEDCTSLSAINVILPSITIGNISGMSFMYYNCTSATGNAPDLWTDYSTATHSACFYNCTSLTNYASIPSGWK